MYRVHKVISCQSLYLKISRPEKVAVGQGEVGQGGAMFSNLKIWKSYRDYDGYDDQALDENYGDKDDDKVDHDTEVNQAYQAKYKPSLEHPQLLHDSCLGAEV